MKLKAKLKNRPGTFLFHGVAGVGKTELMAQFPEVKFLIDPQEDGICDLQDAGFVDAGIDVYEVDDWKGLLSSLDELKKAKCRTVAIETLGGLEALLYNYALKELNFQTWAKFEDFATGPRACSRWVRDLVDKLSAIRETGKTVVMSAHSEVRSFRNPTGGDFDRVFPDCNKQTWKVMAKWFQNVYYMTLDVGVKKSDNVLEKAKGVSCGDRVMWTAPHASYEAKNRYRLPERIEMGKSGAEGFGNLVAAIKEAKVNG